MKGITLSCAIVLGVLLLAGLSSCGGGGGGNDPFGSMDFGRTQDFELRVGRAEE